MVTVSLDASVVIVMFGPAARVSVSVLASATTLSWPATDIVLNTSADDGDRLLFEDGTSDPIAVLASHGITLSGQGWNAFRFENP